MYRPKHEMPRKGIMKYKKSHILLVSLLVIMTIGVGATLAFVMDATDALVNIFNPAHVSCAVVETLENNVKTDVSIQNTSNIPAYIRTTYVVSWQNADGNVYGKVPVEGVDYSISLAEGWTVDKGYYYWSDSVAPDANTGVLIRECKPLKAAPAEDYHLSVEIIAEAIQADGMGVDDAQAAWAAAKTNTGGGT